jgi:protein-S-isoprenylcysteine O-methyltransferase Ste14
MAKTPSQIHNASNKETDMGTILIVILILLLIGGLPVFPHSRSWGYGPSGIIGVVLVVLLILLLLGKI